MNNEAFLKVKKRYLLALGLVWLAGLCPAQKPQEQNSIASFVAGFTSGSGTRKVESHLEDLQIDTVQKEVRVFADEIMAWYHFDRNRVEQTYDALRQLLPAERRDFKLKIYSKGQLLEDLVQGGWDHEEDRFWNKAEHRGNAWVTPLDRPYSVVKGLGGRHLSVTASHGRYYSIGDHKWQWQRPYLFCTTEDLLSQTFVVPYLIPMLENAGAVVYSTRERDWQKNEVIVDNDTPTQAGTYSEQQGMQAWETAGRGFAHLKAVYQNGDDPFTDGTSRKVAAQSRKSQTSSITWTPAIPADGEYAVYVSYPTLSTSVQDAHYTVRHRGQSTTFRVNQQMGGGTWVYLGTFDFGAGQSADNCVVLTNHSAYRGHVTADAVRFGGGMGNIARGDSTGVSISGLPRFLEGARYTAQWAGMPQWVYGNKGFTNDYSEDINVRSLTTNHLARGSAFVPLPRPWNPVEDPSVANPDIPVVLRQDTTGTDVQGLGVPFEMSIALHTDAGFTRDHTTVGSLGIYTTDFNEGRYPSGLRRMAARDVCDLVMSQLERDLQATYGHWSRRQMYDRNYSESREPEVPGIILEMLSHQNFADLCLGHDPTFKFTLARAAYKGILRYIHAMHDDDDVVVQPLPVTALGAYITPGAQQIRVSWLAVEDPLEPSAMPEGFVVYHAEGDGGFDNGTYVTEAHYELDSATPTVLHRFKVCAVNAGGRSMPSEEVCAYLSMIGDKQTLVIDAFDRLAGPQPIDNDSLQGFDLNADPGVPMAKMPGYCGRQTNFSKTGMGREGASGLGYSGSELEGMILAGNTRDWSTRHAQDIIAATEGRMSVSSCTVSAVSRADFDSRAISLMDIVFGAEKADGYSLRPYKVFPSRLIQVAAEFARSGGNLLVSGAYVGSDMTSDADRLFTRSLLKYEYAGALPADSISGITSNDGNFDIHRRLNEELYSVPAVDCLAPTSEAFCPMVYGPTGASAAVAYDGQDYRSMTLGFPLESITDTAMRRRVLMNIIAFLTR